MKEVGKEPRPNWVFPNKRDMTWDMKTPSFGNHQAFEDLQQKAKYVKELEFFKKSSRLKDYIEIKPEILNLHNMTQNASID